MEKFDIYTAFDTLEVFFLLVMVKNRKILKYVLLFYLTAKTEISICLFFCCEIFILSKCKMSE